jgi:hypothetical protein
LELCACLAVLALACSAAARPDAGTAGQPSGVDWQSFVLRATGSGPPDVNALNSAQARLAAEKAARADALKALMSEVRSVPITATRSVGDAMADEEVRGKVEAILRGFKTTAKRYYSDMGVELDAEVSLAPLADLFADAPAATEPAKPAHPKFTGLLIDARKLKVVPALEPRLLDESGNVLHGAGVLGAESRKTAGVASYFRRMDEATKDPRVADKPLLIKGKKSHGSDIVLGADQRKRIAENASLLTSGRVIIVVGQ